MFKNVCDFFINSRYTYLLLCIFIFCIARFVFAIDGLYGQDAYEYLRFTKELHHFWQGNTMPYNFFWPIAFPFYGSLVAFFTPNESWALQLISTFSLVGSLYYIEALLKKNLINFQWLRVYILLFFFLSPYILRGSLLCMSDMLGMFFICGHLFHYINYKTTNANKDLALLVLYAFNAVLTRYAAAILIAPTLFLIGVQLLQKQEFKKIGLSIFIFFIAVLPHIYFTSNGYFTFTKHEWLIKWDFFNFFQRTFITPDGIAKHTFPNIIFYIATAFHPGYFFIGIIILLYAIIKKKIIITYTVFIVAIVLYILFLAGTPIQNSRFVLLLMPFLVVLLYPNFIFLCKNTSKKKLFVCAIILIQCGFFIFSFQKFYKRMCLENQIYQCLQKNYYNIPIYTFDMDVALKGKELKGQLRSLYDERYSSFEKNSLLLFNYEKFKTQWKDKNPMLNWKKVNEHNSLVIKEKFEDGWYLYEIK